MEHDNELTVDEQVEQAIYELDETTDYAFETDLPYEALFVLMQLNY
jgi:hypothetical protein